MEKIKLRFYTIDRCGYYKYRNDTTHLTGIADTLDNIQEWISSKSLQETKTTDVLSVTESLPVYCINVTKLGNNYLFVTWNETEHTEGAVSSISKDIPIGSVADNVESTELPENHIPGYATYFWFIPDDNILATVQFNHQLNGKNGMDYYIKGFLTRFSKYTIMVENSENRGEYEVVGYGTSQETYDEKLHPYFRSNLKRLPGQIEYIRNNYSLIRKMIRKTTITHEIEEDRTFFEKIMYSLGSHSSHILSDELQIKFEIKTQPSIEELNDIIDNWNRDINTDSWDDIGFQLKGMSDETLWLSSEIPSKEFELEATRMNQEIVNFDELLGQLNLKLEECRRAYTTT